MSCYVDTSALVALCTHEPKSDAVSKWYSRSKDTLITSAWSVTEFASALGIKQRTGQLSASDAQVSWQHFQRLCLHDLTLVFPEADHFQQAALLCLDTSSGLRAGDALHLASALHAKAKRMATLDEVFSRNAKQRKLLLVKF